VTALPWILAGAAAVASLALTGGVRRYAIARAVLDVPNARSSHAVATPRGGGLAIAAVVLGATLALAAAGALAPRTAAALAGGLAVAWIGWRDDRRHVPAGVRAAVHAAAALWAIAWLGGLPAVAVGSAAIPLGAAGGVVAAVAVVWCVNLYNFMDGIDGIAGVEAVTAAGTLGAILLAAGRAPLGTLALVVAGAAAGFLYWNRPRARIFMGDVGSGFLGYVLAVLGIAAENAGGVPGVALAALLLAVFVVDATLTLLRRVARGERWAEAHRSHAYQRAVQSGLSHGRVTLAVFATNVVLGALAWRAAAAPSRVGWSLAAGLALVAALYAAVERRRPMAAPARRGPPPVAAG
jgi:Fuc2NAc and GlcNAc transferase